MGSEGRRRLRDQRGNTLLLFPAGLLVLLLLAAIAVDTAELFLGQRRVSDLAASVAQDAVAALDEEAFYGGELGIDVDGATVRQATLTSQLPTDDALLEPSCDVSVGRDGRGPTATATCRARVRFVFAPAVPGADRVAEVTARETAAGRQGP